MSGSVEIERPVVLFVNDSLAMGGIETMIRDFALGLDGSRFSAAVAVFRPGGQLADELRRSGVRVTSLDKRDGLDLGLALRLRRHIRETGARIVHSHNFAAWLYCALATAGLRGVRCVHTEHSRVMPLARRRWLERRLASVTDAVIAVSADVARSLVRDIGVNRQRVGLIANGVNLRRFRPDPDARSAMRAKLGIDERAVVFGILARLVPVKSHQTLVEAFRLLRQQAPDAHLIIAGDGPCRQALERQIGEAGLTDCIHLLGEVSDGERVLNGLDVYVLSSVDEGMNLTLLEAMGTALPVIATAVGGNPEVVVDRLTGLIVPAQQPAALADAMMVLARDEGLRRALGSRGRSRVEETFSQRRTLEEYMALYDGAAVQVWQG